jgi:transposase, IS30 family
LINCLRRAHRKRKQRGIGRKERKTKIPNRISIDARPKIVETRRQFGHWEGDSLISSKSTTALNSLTERKSRLLLLTKLKRKGSMETKDAVISRLQHLPPEARRSLTLDNGTENTQHQEITATLGTKCFFAHPYSSWERGTNENINGLARWYLPKGTDFAKITEQQLSHIESLINNRPRKCLKFKTPNEIVFPSVALHY